MGKGTALPKNIRQIGEIQGKEKVCIEDYVMTYIRKKEPQEENGYLGVFLGERRETEDDTYVFIRGIMELPLQEEGEIKPDKSMEASAEADSGKNSGASAEAGSDKKRAAQMEANSDKSRAASAEANPDKEKETSVKTDGSKNRKTLAEINPVRCKEILARRQAEYFPGWEIQGCCVIGLYQPKLLDLLAEVAPAAGQLVYHLQEQEETLYWKEQEQYRRLRGYFVFYEQNRKMQEYLAEVFRDTSVEKESLPDKAIKNFRAKVKEKSEKRAGSLLRLASSFFVVTVLIIGAIVVNRLDDIRSARNAATTEREVSSGQVQQEGERLPATSYTADGAAGTTADAVSQIEGTTDASAGTVANITAAQSTAAAGTTTGAAADTAAAQIMSDAAQTAASTGTTTDAAQTATAANTTTDDVQSTAAANTVTGGAAGTTTGAAADTAAAQIMSDAAQTAASTDTTTDAAQTATAANTTTDDVQSTAAADTTSDAAAGVQTDADDTDESLEASSRAIRASYVIKQGDTLADICNRYYGNLERVDEICTLNSIADANVIVPGQKIVLP